MQIQNQTYFLSFRDGLQRTPMLSLKNLQKKILSLFQILHKFSMLRVCSRKILKQVIVLKQQSIFRSLFLHVHDVYYLHSRRRYRSIFCFINTIFDRNCILLSNQPFFLHKGLLKPNEHVTIYKECLFSLPVLLKQGGRNYF